MWTQVATIAWTQVATIAGNPVRMPMGEFMKLPYIPLPLMTEDGQKYKEFKDMYGKEPDESCCQSPKPGSLIGMKRKDMLVSAKVRCILNASNLAVFIPRVS